MDVQVNLWAVLLAMLSSMVVGSIWYARPVFGNRWIKLAKVDMSQGKSSDAWRPIAVTAVVSLLTAYVLAHVAYLSNQYFSHSFLQDTLTTAFWVWLGFTAARFITHDAFEGRPALLTLLNVAHEFVTIMIMGLIIGLMGV
jgi:ABC-type Fe3+ transport system permease subunit